MLMTIGIMNINGSLCLRHSMQLAEHTDDKWVAISTRMLLSGWMRFSSHRPMQIKFEASSDYTIKGAIHDMICAFTVWHCHPYLHYNSGVVGLLPSLTIKIYFISLSGYPTITKVFLLLRHHFLYGIGEGDGGWFYLIYLLKVVCRVKYNLVEV